MEEAIEKEKKLKEKRQKERPARLLYSRADAAFVWSCSTRQVDYWVSLGLVRCLRLGKRKIVIPFEEIRRVAEHGLQEVSALRTGVTSES